jgi:hypothetical protein
VHNPMFRAYNKKTNKWVAKDFHLMGEVMASGLLFEGMSLDDWKDITLQMFTGAYDKNQNPIYEGDILITSNNKNLHLFDEWLPEDFGKTECFWDTSEFVGSFNFTTWTPTKDRESVYHWDFVSVCGNIFDGEPKIKKKTTTKVKEF